MKTEESCIRECANVTMINRSIGTLELMNDKLDSFSKLLNLTGNTTRLKIIYLISKEERICVCDLSDILGVSISAISQQLKKMKDSELLKSKKIGQTIYYFINPLSKKFITTLLDLFNEANQTKVA